MENKLQLEPYQRVKVLPFISLPNVISIARLRTALRFRPPGLGLAHSGVFIHNGDEIWSFTALPTLITSLEIVESPNAAGYARVPRSKLPHRGAKYCRGYCESILRIICLALVYMAYT